jgi:flagellar basal-body rod modification protein FlgD
MVNSVNTQNIAQQVTQGGLTNDRAVKDIGKDAFLKLLVAQLKNQDPLEPKDQGAFAVDLAQFTQVEQLTEINKKLGAGDNNINGLASYLGHKVVIAGETLDVAAGDGGSLQVELPSAVNALKVDLKNEEGAVVKTITLAGAPSGKQFVDLKDLDVGNGTYGFDVRGVLSNGSEITLAAKAAGTVTGFIPGLSQTLLLGNREISVDQILEVALDK